MLRCGRLLYQLTKKDIAYLSLYASFIDNADFGSYRVLESHRFASRRRVWWACIKVLRWWRTTRRLDSWWKGGKTRRRRSSRRARVRCCKDGSIAGVGGARAYYYDVPVFDSDAGHCSSFQVNYNSLIQRSYKRLHDYEHLLSHEPRDL